jgi:hypothetical protein
MDKDAVYVRCERQAFLFPNYVFRKTTRGVFGIGMHPGVDAVKVIPPHCKSKLTNYSKHDGFCLNWLDGHKDNLPPVKSKWMCVIASYIAL